MANPTGIPLILGTPVEGQVLTGDQGTIDDPDGINQSTVVFIWHRNIETR